MARSFTGKVAIIQFPGVNCEYETLDAVRSVGLGADLLRWNELSVDAVIRPGDEVRIYQAGDG